MILGELCHKHFVLNDSGTLHQIFLGNLFHNPSVLNGTCEDWEKIYAWVGCFQMLPQTRRPFGGEKYAKKRTAFGQDVKNRVFLESLLKASPEPG